MAVLELARMTPSEIALLRAVAAAADARIEPVLVGGVVRDARLGRRRRPDVDVAVASGALALARRVATGLGGSYVALDEERGAARVLAGGGQLDITDFRAPTLAEDLAARD